jgi:hypothetical protein
VTYAGTSGVLQDSANLTFDGTSLVVGAASNPLATRAVISNSGDAYALTLGDIATFTNRTGVFFRGGNENRIGWDTAGYLTFFAGSNERMRLDTSGNLLLGTTTAGAGVGVSTKLTIDAGSGDSSVFKTSTSSSACIRPWNSATSGNNNFLIFFTETGATDRGGINYNRGAGLIGYNTTSDYRAKDIYGPVTNSGEVIDSVPVYMGKMKGATQERPMFIAHETPAYAHTGEKDAVNENGDPIYQQMDASALVPILWAEVKSLRARIAALEAK